MNFLISKKFLKKIIFFQNTFKQNRYYLSLTNLYLGLARGPIDHESSSVINVIANEAITMGDAVQFNATIPSDELLPRVEVADAGQGLPVYGIAVGGDTDGVYGDGSAATTDLNRATASAGQGVVVVTQGRCPARVSGGSIVVGSKLTQSATAGTLELAATSDEVIAIALQPSSGSDIIAVDVQRGGIAA